MSRYATQRGVEFRRNVAMYLKLVGLPVEIPVHQRVSAAMADALPASHVAGVKDFALLTRGVVHARPAESLAAAREAADETGATFAAVVMARADKPVDESYVLMSLSDFALLSAERMGVKA